MIERIKSKERDFDGYIYNYRFKNQEYEEIKKNDPISISIET